MTEAVVRACSALDGKLSAVIPDECLEQTSPVVAWVYCVGLTDGETILTVYMPVIPRTRPAPSATVPPVITDRYTELVDAINEQIEKLSEGAVTARNAIYAESALSAQSADQAEFAELAGDANWADKAGLANKATEADHAFETRYLEAVDYKSYTANQVLTPGVYMVIDGKALIMVDSRASYSAPYYGDGSGTLSSSTMYRLAVSGGSEGFLLERYSFNSSTLSWTSMPSNLNQLKYRLISGYAVG